MSRCSVDILETLLLHTRPRSLILLNKTPEIKASIPSWVTACCGDERIMVFTRIRFGFPQVGPGG
jgi:hypothetical protein